MRKVLIFGILFVLIATSVFLLLHNPQHETCIEKSIDSPTKQNIQIDLTETINAELPRKDEEIATSQKTLDFKSDNFQKKKSGDQTSQSQEKKMKVVEERMPVFSKTQKKNLSISVLLKPFNLEQYKQKPRSYLDEVVPARAFQHVLNPGKGVPELEFDSPYSFSIKPNEEIKLRVKTPKANCPVSFTSLGGGLFKKSKRNSITTASNKNCIAEVTFTVAETVTGDGEIIAGCPMAAGYNTFNFHVISQ